MKLYSRLLGWIGILTKSCVSPQVFYGCDMKMQSSLLDMDSS